MPFLLDALDYTDLTHTYRVDHAVVPGVTSILDLVPPRSTLLQYCRGAELEAKRQLGTAVHSACHFYDEGTLDYKTIPIDGPVYPYLEGWMRFRSEADYDILDMETLVLHRHMGYAGRFDRMGRRRGTTRRVLLDIKTGQPSSACAGPQTAAYVAALLSQQDKWEPIDRMSIHLPGDGTYKEYPHHNRADFDFFKAALFIFNVVGRIAA